MYDVRSPYERSKVNPYWRTCPLCTGTGINPKLITHVCPKCNGEKEVRRA